MIEPTTGREALRFVCVAMSILVCAGCSRGDAANAEAGHDADLFPGPPGDPGSLLHASGFEPGWTLDVYDDRMVYVGRYGEERVVTPPPEPLPTKDPDAEPKQRTWVAHTDTYDFKVRVVDEPCRDPRGGTPLPLTVYLSVGGQEYQGCGHDG